MNKPAVTFSDLKSLTLTYSTRIRLDNVEDRRYFDDRFEYYSQIEHELFNGLAHGKLHIKGLWVLAHWL